MPDPRALAYVVYSSGSTGKPKGSEISHANLASLVDWHNAAFDLGPTDRVAHLAGLGFDAAVWEVWPPLCVGATLVLAPEDVRVSPEALRDWLVAERITVAFVPTVLAERLIALGWPAGCALRTLLTGGDRLHSFPPAGLPFALVNNYGPSECTVVATSGVVAPGGERLPSIGWPIDGTTIELRDADGHPVTDGMPGEIVIGGAGVGQGYRGRPDLSAERFIVEDGRRHFRTGDLGVRGPDGAIAFVGRVDDQVQVRGHRVEPAEVAAVLARHAGVASAAVIAITEGGQVSLAAYLVLRPGHRPGAVEMRDFAGAHLPPAMIPARYLVIDALPLTANGKLDRAALPHPEHAERLAEAALVLPETPVEAKLAELLSVIMHGRAIGIDDNFFMIGGHSLLGAQLVLRAGEAFGVELTLRDLFAAPTIRQLAQAVEAKVIAMVTALSDAETLARIDG